MALVHRPRPKLNAKQVAALVGGYSFHTVLNKRGPFKDLTVYRHPSAPRRPLYDPDEVDALIQSIEADSQAEA